MMNIGDVARLAGVSSAAVSRYFNHRSLSEEKRAAIQKVVEETGFRPSMQARLLRTKKTNLVGAVMPRINSAAVSRIVWGILSALEEGEYHLVLADTSRSTERELDYLSFFDSRQVDGILLLGTFMEERQRELIRELSVPTVVIGQKAEGLPCVYQPDGEAAYALSRLVLEGGSRFPCYMGADERDSAVGRDRRAGFVRACSEAGLTLPKERFCTADFSLESGEEMAREMLRRFPQLDALICATDDMAVGALMCLRQMGIDVPGRVQVAGFGDAKIGRVVSPSLTTVHFDYEQTGRDAVAMLLSLMEGGEAEQICLPSRLVERESTRRSGEGKKTEVEGESGEWTMEGQRPSVLMIGVK